MSQSREHSFLSPYSGSCGSKSLLQSVCFVDCAAWIPQSAIFGIRLVVEHIPEALWPRFEEGKLFSSTRSVSHLSLFLYPCCFVVFPCCCCCWVCSSYPYSSSTRAHYLFLHLSLSLSPSCDFFFAVGTRSVETHLLLPSPSDIVALLHRLTDEGVHKPIKQYGGSQTNAVVGLWKVASRFQGGGGMSADDIYAHCLQLMPLRGDTKEVQYMNENVLDMIERFLPPIPCPCP